MKLKRGLKPNLERLFLVNECSKGYRSAQLLNEGDRIKPIFKGLYLLSDQRHGKTSDHLLRAQNLTRMAWIYDGLMWTKSGIFRILMTYEKWDLYITCIIIPLQVLPSLQGKLKYNCLIIINSWIFPSIYTSISLTLNVYTSISNLYYDLILTLLSFPRVEMRSAHSLVFSKLRSVLSTAAT